MKIAIEIPEADSRMKEMGWRLDFSFLEKIQATATNDDIGRIGLEECEEVIFALHQMQTECDFGPAYVGRDAAVAEVRRMKAERDALALHIMEAISGSRL